MSGYVKNIAVIKTLKTGFSADGGMLSGIIKCEKYASRLRVEISFINFAPLSEGRYVTALSDGKNKILTDADVFDGESELSPENGFCALICFVNKTVLPIASAVCGNFAYEIAKLSAFVESEEKIKSAEESAKENLSKKQSVQNKSASYDDEALAEDNYYEYDDGYEERGTLRKDKKEEKEQERLGKDEKNTRFEQKPQNENRTGESLAVNVDIAQITNAAINECVAPNINSESESINFSARYKNEAVSRETKADGLARGKAFYEEMKEEVERVLSYYPQEKELCAIVENSRWVKINYGENKFYVFGVIYEEKTPQYVCYGIPSENAKTPPQSLKGRASFIPSSTQNYGKGYWVMFQDAATGASVEIEEA